MIVVRPTISSSSASRMMDSVFESIEDVARREMRIGASLRNAREHADALAITSRQAHAALADVGLVTLGHAAR
jgi:hypothetical protein